MFISPFISFRSCCLNSPVMRLLELFPGSVSQHLLHVNDQVTLLLFIHLVHAREAPHSAVRSVATLYNNNTERKEKKKPNMCSCNNSSLNGSIKYTLVFHNQKSTGPMTV